MVAGLVAVSSGACSKTTEPPSAAPSGSAAATDTTNVTTSEALPTEEFHVAKEATAEYKDGLGVTWKLKLAIMQPIRIEEPDAQSPDTCRAGDLPAKGLTLIPVRIEEENTGTRKAQPAVVRLLMNTPSGWNGIATINDIPSETSNHLGPGKALDVRLLTGGAACVPDGLASMVDLEKYPGGIGEPYGDNKYRDDVDGGKSLSRVELLVVGQAQEMPTLGLEAGYGSQTPVVSLATS